ETSHSKNPIYAGFSILEMSKILMYNFVYNQIRRVSRDARVAYSDTDSFILQVSGRD
ncbi:hypothetical protein IscW_ISCW006835, partial [Ixodes scapularis]